MRSHSPGLRPRVRQPFTTQNSSRLIGFWPHLSNAIRVLKTRYGFIHFLHESHLLFQEIDALGKPCERLREIVYLCRRLFCFAFVFHVLEQKCSIDRSVLIAPAKAITLAFCLNNRLSYRLSDALETCGV